MTGAHAFASKVAAGQFDPAVHAWLVKGFSAHAAACGTRPLEDCLRIPRTTKASVRAIRDAWLLRAWMLTDSNLTPWGRSKQLADLAHEFDVKWWRKEKWKELSSPPDGTSELRTALFMTMKAGAYLPDQKRIHGICVRRQGKFLSDAISLAVVDNEAINHKRKK